MKECKVCGKDLEVIHPKLAHALVQCIIHTKTTQQLTYTKKGPAIHNLPGAKQKSQKN